jgi:hypothetical protein
MVKPLFDGFKANARSTTFILRLDTPREETFTGTQRDEAGILEMMTDDFKAL